MKQILFTLSFVATAAFAAPGTYQGNGTMVFNGKTVSYTTKVVATENANKDLEVSETYSSDGQPDQTYLETFKFASDGTFRIEIKGVRVGGGYCFPQKDQGEWCDYNMETAQGHLHANLFRDAHTGTMFRMGDYTMSGQTGRWNDTLALVGKP